MIVSPLLRLASMNKKIALGLGIGAYSLGRTLSNRDRTLSSNYGTYETSSPLMSATQNIGSDLISGSGLIGITGSLGLMAGSSMAGKPAIDYWRQSIKDIRALPRSEAPPKTSLRHSRPLRRGITGKIKKRSNKDIMKALGKSIHPEIASKAKLSLKLGRFATALGWGSLVMSGFRMVADNFQIPDPIRPYTPPARPSIGGTFSDSEEAYTQRQRALQAIQSTQYGGRASFGNEASFMHL